MRIHKLIFFIAYCTILFSCTSVKKLNYIVSEKKHTPTELKADVDYAYNLLTKGHPGVYWYIKKEQLAFKFDSLKASLVTPLTTKELYLKLAPLVAEINCGHTRLILVTKKLNKFEKDSLEKLGKPIQQMGYKVIDDKLYITTLNKKINLAKKGDEILAINNIPTKEILDNISKNYASDGYNKTFKTAVLNRAFPSWYTAIYENSDTLAYQLRQIDSVFNLTLTTIKKEEKKDSLLVKKAVVKMSKDSLLAKKKLALEKKRLRYKGSDENKKPILDFRFLEKDSSVAYLKIKSFSFPYANFNRFYKESFILLKKGKTKNLILDLRDNGGGSLAACRDLFSYLVDKDFTYLKAAEINNKFNPYWQGKGFGNAVSGLAYEITTSRLLERGSNGEHQVKFKGTKPLKAHENNYDGKLYVLINGYSFSASSLLSSNLKQIKRATFVGQETGGGFNGCVAGRIPVLSLPSSKLKLRMGMFPVIPNAYTETVGRGIFPDQEIETTIDDVIKGKDKELDWVLQTIKK